MTQRDFDKTQQLDRTWDRYQDMDGHTATDSGDHHDEISRLHQRDNAPAPSAEFRTRLQAELQAMHPGTTGAQSAEDPGDMADGHEAPTTIPSGTRPRGPITFNRPSSFRQWGELAAIIAILSLAIAGAALYGDEAYDLTQRSLSPSDDGAVDISEHAAVLEEEGEVHGLTFEEAQALTPFEMVEATSLPDDASIEHHEVTKSEIVERGRLHFVMWRSTTEIAVDAGIPILVRQQPAMQHLPIPMPRVEGGSEPSGRLQTVQIGDTGAVRVTEHTEEGEIITHYAWQQGDVDIWLEIPFDVTDPDNPVEGFDQMMASLVEQGPLDDGAGEIENRELTLAELREAMPTVPVADPTPEHLELHRADISIYGPHFSYEHTGSADVDSIWIRAMGAVAGMHFHERVADVVSGTVNVGDVLVSQHILTDRFAPETSEFIEAVGLHADLLLPWISRDSDTALVVYMWNVAGQGYLMGVEIPHDRIEMDNDEPTIATDRPETDWLEIITAQDRFVAEHLDLEEIFPVFADEPTEDDQIPGQEDANSRRIGATSDGLYYLAYDDDRNMIMLYQFVEVEGEDAPRSSGGGNALWHTAEYGIAQQMGGGGAGFHVAWALPQGYDEVVDEDGNLVGKVENQMFAMSFGDDDPRPRPLIARGPAGELYLDQGSIDS